MVKLNSYIDRGKGFPILFVHAFPLNHKMWMPQMEYLQKFYRVIAFDMHGFGNAPSVDHPLSIEDYADEIIDLLDHLGIEQCIVAGLSLGGYIVFALLKKYPNRFRGAILANTRAGADSDEAKNTRFAQATEIRAIGMKTFIDTMVNRLVGEYSKQNRKPVQLSLRTIMEQALPEATARMLEAMAARPDSLDALDNLSIPVCLVCGEEDTITPVAEMERIHQKLSNAEFHVLPRCGHLTNMEDADAFNRIIKEFSDRIVS